MVIVFTAQFRVSDWQSLRRLSDETLILYAWAAGARHYRLYRNTHDATEALLLVEAASTEVLRPLRDALLSQNTAQHGWLAIDGRLESPDGRMWESAECRSIE